MRYSRSEGVRKIFFSFFFLFFSLLMFWIGLDFSPVGSWIYTSLYLCNELFVCIIVIIIVCFSRIFIYLMGYVLFFFFFFWKARMCCSINQYIDSLIKSFFIVKKNITLYSSFAQKSNLLLHLSIV